MGYINYSIHRAYHDQIDAVKAHMDAARVHLEEGGAQGATRAEGELSEARIKHGDLTLPRHSLFSFDFIHNRIDKDYAATDFNIDDILQAHVIPELYIARAHTAFDSDPALAALGNFPPLEGALDPTPDPARPRDDLLNPRGLSFNGLGVDTYRPTFPLTEHLESTPHLVLLANANPSLLHVIRRRDALNTLSQHHLAIEVDLSAQDPHAGALENAIITHMKTMAGFVGERAELFQPDGLLAMMREGACTLYFHNLEATARSRNIAHIQSVIGRYPECRSRIFITRPETKRLLATLEPAHTLTSLVPLSPRASRAHLRAQTSASYAEHVYRIPALRQAITHEGDPILLSLLIDHHRVVGTPPGGLAPLFERRVHVALAQPGTHTRDMLIAALTQLASPLLEHGSLSRRDAVQRLNTTLMLGRNLDGASTLLDALVARGLLRLIAQTHVEFLDRRVFRLAVALHAATLPAEDVASMLLEHADPARELTAFVAAFYPDPDALYDRLVGRYFDVHAKLVDRGLENDAINPYIPTLWHAAQVVQHAPTLSAERTQRLEDEAFRLLEHRAGAAFRNATMSLLTALSTPRVLSQILYGIETLGPRDELHVRALLLASELPFDVYAGALERWLARLFTERDPHSEARLDCRVHTQTGCEGQIVGSATMNGIANAIDALVRIGSPESLRVVEQIASTSEDPRFPSAQWQQLRRIATHTLLVHGHLHTLTRRLPEVVADPVAWASLVPLLYRLSSPETAHTLIAVLEAPSPNDPTAARQLRQVQRQAAHALAFVDPEHADPAIADLLAKPVDTTLGARLYLFTTLGYRGTPEALELAKSLIPPLLNMPEARTEDTLGRVLQGLAYFGTSEAWTVAQDLLAREDMRVDMAHGRVFWSHFRVPEAEDFLVQRMICDTSDTPTAHFNTHLQALAAFYSETSRAHINRLSGVECPQPGGSSKRRVVARAGLHPQCR